MSKPALSDQQLDDLLAQVRKTRSLPQGVVWAGEMNDGEVLHVGLDLNGRTHYELCIKRRDILPDGRHWELVRPLMLFASPGNGA